MTPKDAVNKWLDALVRHDAWLWWETAECLRAEINFDNPVVISRGGEHIEATMTNGNPVTLDHDETGWSLDFGRRK